MNKRKKLTITYEYVGDKGTEADKAESKRRVAEAYDLIFTQAFAELKKKKSMYIKKANNEPSPLDPYIERVWQFMGAVIALGNSIILILSALFARKGMKPINSGMLGPYIKQLEEMGVDVKLVNDLKEYNKYLNLAKHSVLVADEKLMKKKSKQIVLQDITTQETHMFDEQTQQRITELASSIMENIRKYG